MRIYAYNAKKGIQWSSLYYLNISEREAIKRYRNRKGLKGKHNLTFLVSV